MNDSTSPYLHGYSSIEQQRLRDQAQITERLIYRDVDFMDQSHILEVGCGVGAQTEILLRRFPFTQVTGIDLNQEQLDSAAQNLGRCPWAAGRYELLPADASAPPFQDNTFDGAFLCWVLEHVPEPVSVLQSLSRVLAPESPVWITEVLNSTFFLDPYSPALWQYWMAFNDYQYEQAGDPFVGAKLGNLLLEAGFSDIQTQVKTFHYDRRNPRQRQAIIAFWQELLLSAADSLLSAGRVDEPLVQAMRRELAQVQNNPDAVFFYSFIQAHARVSR
jgi:ubiquinone/menaquinone biosynthesis C-methylase UbiE